MKKKIKKVIKGLNNASKLHAKQAKTLKLCSRKEIKNEFIRQHKC